MATLLTTRHWGSDESFTCFGKTYASKIIQSQENLNNDKSISMSGKLPEDNPPSQPMKRKALNVASRHTKSKTAKGYSGIILEPSHVKASALLYEITERTNQLAQPRIRTTEDKLSQLRPSVSQIPKASPRIIELSKPRIPYHSPPKPIGYVAPGALTAVATQRIIELSKPKRKRRTKIANQRKSKLHKEKPRNYVKRGKKKERKYGTFLRHKNDRKMKNKRKQSSLKTSNSDRTIIMVGLKLKNEKKIRRHL